MGRKDAEVRGKGGEPVVPGAGPRMRIARGVADLTLQEVADKIGTVKEHLSAVETSQANLGLYLFFEYCNAVDGDPTYILTGRSIAPDPALADFFEAWRMVVGPNGMSKLTTLTVDEIRLSWERGMEAVELARFRDPKP